MTKKTAWLVIKEEKKAHHGIAHSSIFVMHPSMHLHLYLCSSNMHQLVPTDQPAIADWLFWGVSQELKTRTKHLQKLWPCVLGDWTQICSRAKEDVAPGLKKMPAHVHTSSQFKILWMQVATVCVPRGLTARSFQWLVRRTDLSFCDSQPTGALRTNAQTGWKVKTKSRPDNDG